MVILTSLSKFMRNLHSVVRPPRKLFCFGKNHSMEIRDSPYSIKGMPEN